MTRYQRTSALVRRALLVTVVALTLASCSPAVAARQSPNAAERLNGFYATEPTGRLPLGTLLREEPLTSKNGSVVVVPHATAHRILYVSRSSDGKQTTSSAMMFVPTSAPPKGGRPVVAWAHPTRSPTNVAPSRSFEPLLGVQPWLDEMINRG
jgi:hypothetical protein